MLPNSSDRSDGAADSAEQPPRPIAPVGGGDKVKPVIAIALLGAILFLPLLGSFGLWDPNEVRIADLAKEAAHSPGWMLPTRTGARPPLPIWAVVIGYHVLGTSELGGRLPIALLSLLTLLACYYAGGGLLRRRGALIGAVALATSPAIFLGARQLTTFITPVLAATLAIGGLARAAWPRLRDDGSDGNALWPIHLVVGVLGLVLGFYAGGAGLGVLVPLLALSVALAATGGPRRVMLVAAAGSVAALAATWLAWRSSMPGGEHPGGYSPILGGGARISSHQIEYVTLLKQIGFGSFPWVALLPLAVARALEGTGKTAPAATESEAAADEQAAFGRWLLMAWVVAAYLADSLFAASVGDVGYSAYAGVALLAGSYLDEIWDRRASFAYAGLIACLGASVIAHDFFITPEDWAGAHVLEGIKWPGPLTLPPYFFLLVGVLWGVLVGLACGVLPLQKNGGPAEPSDGKPRSRYALDRQSLLIAALVVAGIGAAGSTYWVVPEISKHLSYKGLYTKFKALSGPAGSAEIGRYHVPGQLSEYGQSTDLPTLQAMFEFLARPKRVFVIAASDDLAAIDQFAKSKAAAAGADNYFVVDDTNSRFLLLSNQVGEKEPDLNPLKRFVVKTLARPPQVEAHADFEGKIQLVGYDLPPELERGKNFKITMYYKVTAPVGGAYKSFLHFDGPGTRFNGDHIPLEGRFPTNDWVPGYYVIDEHTMEPDRAMAPAGTYQLYVGFWQGDARLKVVSGQSDGENRVKLGTVRVK